MSELANADYVFHGRASQFWSRLNLLFRQHGRFVDCGRHYDCRNEYEWQWGDYSFFFMRHDTEATMIKLTIFLRQQPRDQHYIAALQAFEVSDDRVEVRFADGVRYYGGRVERGYLPIGAPFEEFCQLLVDGAGLSSTPASEQAIGGYDGTPHYPNWFPKRPKTLKKWKKAWAITVRLDKIYRKRALDALEADAAKVTYAEYADALAHEMGWRASDKTIGRIREAGLNGWLDS